MISDVIADLAIPLTVQRRTSETVSGLYAKPTYSVVPGQTGHMQPMSAKELRNVPEGQNTQEWWHVWSLSELRVNDHVSDGAAPTVVIQRVEYWKEGQFWHGQATAVRATETGSGA